MRKRLEILLAFALLAGAAGFAAYELDVFEMPTGPSCADPCYIVGNGFDTAQQRWYLEMAHCTDTSTFQSCDPQTRVTVTMAEWRNWRLGQRYTGAMGPK